MKKHTKSTKRNKNRGRKGGEEEELKENRRREAKVSNKIK